jgi:hypothetical protein
MRRLIMVLTLMLVATLMSAGNASAKGFTSCSPVKTTINGKKYVIAIKVKTKGMSCGATAAFWIAFATGEPGSERTEDLRTNCKLGSKATQKAAEKKGRSSYVCRSSDRKIVAKAWVLGG